MRILNSNKMNIQAFPSKLKFLRWDIYSGQDCGLHGVYFFTVYTTLYVIAQLAKPFIVSCHVFASRLIWNDNQICMHVQNAVWIWRLHVLVESISELLSCWSNQILMKDLIFNIYRDSPFAVTFCSISRPLASRLEQRSGDKILFRVKVINLDVS